MNVTKHLTPLSVVRTNWQKVGVSGMNGAGQHRVKGEKKGTVIAYIKMQLLDRSGS